MICECGRDHEIEGQILVDGWPVPSGWTETLVEIMCRHGKLGIEPEGPKPLDEPDV